MKFSVKVRVNTETLHEFATALKGNDLDKSCIISETYCLRNDPSVGFSVWEADSRNELDIKFKPWSEFYTETEITEIITADEAFKKLISKAV